MKQQPVCPFCTGRRGSNATTNPELELTPLEQEAPHDPDCPLLSRKPIRHWVAALIATAATTVAVPNGCQSNDPSTNPGSNRHFVTRGLDDGTISAAPEPEFPDSDVAKAS